MIMYRMTVQFAGERDDFDLFRMIPVSEVPRDAQDVEDDGGTCCTFSFRSAVRPGNMFRKLLGVMNREPDIVYIDVLYRFEYEINHDRLTVFPDGTCQEYRTYPVYEEDGPRHKI